MHDYGKFDKIRHFNIFILQKIIFGTLFDIFVNFETLVLIILLYLISPRRLCYFRAELYCNSQRLLYPTLQHTFTNLIFLQFYLVLYLFVFICVCVFILILQWVLIATCTIPSVKHFVQCRTSTTSMHLKIFFAK